MLYPIELRALKLLTYTIQNTYGETATVSVGAILQPVSVLVPVQAPKRLDVILETALARRLHNQPTPDQVNNSKFALSGHCFVCALDSGGSGLALRSRPRTWLRAESDEEFHSLKLASRFQVRVPGSHVD